MYDEYKELVRLLKDKAERFDYDGWVDTAVVMEKAADAIEKLIEVIQNHDFLESLIKPRWIPVTKRLPEIDEKHHCSKDVLAYLKDGGMCFTALEENIFGQACFECERNPAVEEEMIVTHWMPLPEPPKEEKK